jgi:hypothetical protein
VFHSFQWFNRSTLFKLYIRGSVPIPKNQQ